MTGFKNFILRGNLIELAVAFIIGGAFATVVTSFTNVVLSAITRASGGPPNFDSIEWFQEQDAAGADIPGSGVLVGPFFTALIAFLILAAVVYFFVVVPYTRAKERFFPAEEPGTPADIALLTEIRDAIVANKGGV
ncbi:MAG TPA: MscL family protein [Nocardioidaceae bacterium]|nr:MscL family protein [Nocardioidaceae bacterium]